MKSFITYILSILALILSSAGYPYEFKGNKWIGGKATIYANMPGISDSGVPWNTAFNSALSEWNEKTVFEFTALPIYRDPCVVDGLNSVKFAKDVCGQKFNDATLAVTVLKYSKQQLGPDAIIETDVFVKETAPFDVYNLKRIQPDTSVDAVDFRRTILHELGHVIGLDHEESKEAIMQSKYSDIFSLQPDDIEGANKLYTGLSNCVVKRLKFGKTADALRFPDCTVKDLTLGGTDESLLDLYSFTISAPTQVDFAVNSAGLESVIIIADTDLNYVAVDSDISGLCDAKLEAQLAVGNYFLMVNTFDNQVKERCGLRGAYELIASYTSKSPVDLNYKGTPRNNNFGSEFIGSITGNQGESYGNRFSSKDSVDISASITIDTSHSGEDGYIVVAAVIGDQVMLLDAQGQFIDFSSIGGSIIRASEKKLEEIETIEIAKDLIAKEYGIEEISVDFFVGYGLIREPGKIYSHNNPLNLTITSAINMN
tara:strand:+ start:1579 stop:3030 length:1452 start_codon:yes stop_codon:yes gene_type:complete